MGYYGRSLQDILGQGYDEQPTTGIADATGQIPPSAYSQMAEEDDQFVPAATDAISRLLQPQADPRSQQIPDMAYGRASSHERGNRGVPDDETTAMEVAGALIKLPFGLLNEGRNLLQDTLGLPGAQHRQRAQDEMEMLKNLPQWQRQQLGIDNISAFQTQNSQPNEGSGTAGAPSSLGQGGQSTMKGFVEWTGNLGRDRAQQQMNEARSAIKLAMARGELSRQQADVLYKATGAHTNLAQSAKLGEETRGQQIVNQYLPRQEEATLRVKGTAADANTAQAGASNASAFNQRQQGLTHQEKRPYEVEAAQAGAQGAWGDSAKKWADADKSQGDAYHNWTLGGPLVQSQIDKNRGDIYQSVAAGDYSIAGIPVREAQAGAIRDTTPLRQDLIRSQTNLTDQKGVTEIRSQEKLDTQTRAIADIAASQIEKIQAQITGLVDATGLTHARTRLAEIKGDALMSEEMRAAAMDDVRRALLETRTEIAQRAQGNNDLIAQAKLKFIDADIARLESIVSLNGLRGNAVGRASSLNGGSSFGKALLSQEGRESQAHLNALLNSTKDDQGTVYDRGNRYDMLGYEYGKDYGIVPEDSGDRWGPWNDEPKPARIVYPKGSRLRGAAKDVIEEAPAARMRERTAEPSPAFDDGPAAGSPETGQPSYEARRKSEPYKGLSKRAAFAAVKADVEARKLSESEAYSIIAALGIERKR